MMMIKKRKGQSDVGRGGDEGVLKELLLVLVVARSAAASWGDGEKRDLAKILQSHAFFPLSWIVLLES